MAFDDSKKNKGPLLKSYNVGGSAVIGGEWIAKAGTVQEEQKVPLSFVLPGSNGGPGPLSPVQPPSILIDDVLVQTLTDERKRTTLTLNQPPSGIGTVPPGGGPPGSWTLVEELRLPVGQVATRTRALVPEGSHLVLTDEMLQAEQSNKGVALEQVVLTAPLPGPTVIDARFDDLANIFKVEKTRKLVSDIVVGEVLRSHTGPGGGSINLPATTFTRTKVTKEGETATVATEVVASDQIPGMALLTWKLEPDGSLVTITRTKKLVGLITKGETVNAAHTLWTRTYADGETGLVAVEVVEAKALPTPVVISTRVEPDGTTSVVTKRKRHQNDIVTGESLQDVFDNGHPPNHIGFNWVKTYREGESGLVATEVVEVKFISDASASNLVTSVSVNGEMQLTVAQKKLKRVQDIFETALVSGTIIGTTESEAVSDLVATQINTTRNFTDKALYSRSTEIGLPAEYRGLVVTRNTENVVIGDSTHRAAMPTALAAGEIEKSEQQIDNLLKRKGLKVIDTTTIPPSTTEELSTEYGGMIMNVTKTVKPLGDTALNITDDELTNYNVISDKVSSYGTFGIRETKVKQGAAFPLLRGADVDPTLNLFLPYTQQVVSAAAALPSPVPGSYTETKPLDAARSLRTIRSAPTGLDLITDFVMIFPGTTNVDFPPELVSCKWTGTTSAGAGSYGSQGNYSIYNGGSGGIDLRGRANGSAAASIDIVPVIKQTHGQNISCHHYLFFMTGPSLFHGQVLSKIQSFPGLTGTVSWPTFKPEAIQIVCKGQSLRATADVDRHFYDSFGFDYLGAVKRSGFSRNNGSGTSLEVEVVSKTVTIPPTIHGDITITGDGSNYFASYQANGLITVDGFGTTSTVPLSGQAVASLSTLNITHTGGSHSRVPTTGNFITSMKVEPYKFGYFKCDVEVVNAGAWQ